MIVSSKSQEIQDSFLEENGHGITIYQGLKGYGKKGVTQNREIIHIVINRIDIKRITRMIDNIDEDAFIIEFDVNDVKGGKIRKILSK